VNLPEVYPLFCENFSICCLSSILHYSFYLLCNLYSAPVFLSVVVLYYERIFLRSILYSVPIFLSVVYSLSCTDCSFYLLCNLYSAPVFLSVITSPLFQPNIYICCIFYSMPIFLSVVYSQFCANLSICCESSILRQYFYLLSISIMRQSFYLLLSSILRQSFYLSSILYSDWIFLSVVYPLFCANISICCLSSILSESFWGLYSTLCQSFYLFSFLCGSLSICCLFSILCESFYLFSIFHSAPILLSFVYILFFVSLSFAYPLFSVLRQSFYILFILYFVYPLFCMASIFLSVVYRLFKLPPPSRPSNWIIC
jgi:hypothetical protein